MTTSKRLAPTVLSAVALVAAGAHAVDPVVVPIVPLSADGWTYAIGPHGFLPGFESPAFDDAAWNAGATPFATGGGYCGYPQAVFWPLDTDLLLRRTFVAPPTAQIVLTVQVDNDVQAFLDGTPLTELVEFDGCGGFDRYQLVLPTSASVPHLLAIRARDRGSYAFCDLRIEAVFTADCDGDGIVDYAQIADGSLVDLDGDLVPDCCPSPPGPGCCPADLDRDGEVNANDIALILGNWGPAHPKSAAFDLDLDGQIDGNDLAIILARWGICD